VLNAGKFASAVTKERGAQPVELRGKQHGEELPFDISASNKREIRVGDSAEVTIGIGYTGKPKAKMLVFEVETDRAPTFQAGFKQLQSFGFLKQWDLKQAKAAAKELLDDMPAKLLRATTGELLRKYYGEGISEGSGSAAEQGDTC